MVSKKVKVEKSQKTQKKPKDFLIAIVDDHIQTAVAISQMLEHAGFRTAQTYSPADGITLCERLNPDLLLLDIKLDGVTGYYVAEKLPEQKLLFITGFDVDETRVRDFPNAIGVMKKPLDMEELIQTVKKELKIKS